MRRYKGPFDPDGLTISYKELGTISIDELAHAVVADILALKEIYNVRYVTVKRLPKLTPDRRPILTPSV
jgi:hypothetical protein